MDSYLLQERQEKSKSTKVALLSVVGATLLVGAVYTVYNEPQKTSEHYSLVAP